MGGEGEAVGLEPDPHRLERTHVVGVRLDRGDRYIVRCSDGIDMAWDEWCAWGCRDLRRSALAPSGSAGTGEAVASPDGRGAEERNG